METFKLFDEFPILNSTPEQLQSYLANKKIEHTNTKIRNSTHIRSISHGFEIEYECQQLKNSVVSLFLYFNNSKIKPYSFNFSLPFLLHPTTTIKGAILMLGEPKNKSKFMTECSWNNLGIDIIYSGMGWSNENVLMDYLCLYPKEEVNECCVCHKNLGITKPSVGGCTRCKGIIEYCGEECQEKHYRDHLILCQEVE